MVLPTGESPLSFSQIRDEFGTEGTDSATAPVRLGQYRSSDPSFTNENLGELTNLPLDTGIPTSGTINVESFHGKKLNTVVDMYESGNSTYNFNIKTSRFDTGNYDFVGGYRDSLSPSTWQGGKKIIVHVNKTFSSTGAGNNTDHVAVTIGTGWPANTEFHFDLGSSAVIAGKGGDGGNGGNGSDNSTFASGQSGKDGSSALKIETGTSYNLVSGAVIVGGGGGGGGGAGASQDDLFDHNEAGGGGGGGGAGIPSGSPGEAENDAGGAQDGGNATSTTGGEGGEGGRSGSPPEAIGTDGGDGGVGEKITSAGDTAPVEGQPGKATGGQNTKGSHGDPGGESGSAIIYF